MYIVLLDFGASILNSADKNYLFSATDYRKCMISSVFKTLPVYMCDPLIWHKKQKTYKKSK